MTSTETSATPATRAEALHRRDRTCQTLGIRLDDVGPGHATVRMTVADTMSNGHGAAHGGYLFLLADAAFSFASNTHAPVAVAQSAHVTFLAPVSVGDELVATATERVRLGLTGIYDVTVRRDGATVVEFRGHSVLLPGRSRQETSGRTP